MGNPQHLEMAKKGYEVFNRWREAESIEAVDFSDLDLSRQSGFYNLEGANLSRANLSRARLVQACFGGAVLNDASLTHADCTRASFTNARFQGTDISFANFYEASLRGTDFTGVKGAHRARNLETTRDSYLNYFDKCERPFIEKYASWEVIRNVGNLRLFAVSYTLLAFLMTSFYLVGFYNDRVLNARDWARAASESPDPTRRALGEQLARHLTTYRFSRSTGYLFIASLMLVAASALYSFWCPDEVKDFTRSQWVYQLDKPLIHYWALAWRHRWCRVLCGLLYFVGGLMMLGILAVKFTYAVSYIWRYSTL